MISAMPIAEALPADLLKEQVEIHKINQKKLQWKRNELTENAHKFVAYFLKQMVDTMQDTVDKTGLMDGGHGEEVFQEQLNYEWARLLSEDMNGLMKQMDRTMGQSLDRQLAYVAGELNKLEKNLKDIEVPLEVDR